MKKQLYIQLEDIVADVTKAIEVLYTKIDEIQIDEAVTALFDFRTHEIAKPVTAVIYALEYLMNTQMYDITVVSRVLRSSTEQVKVAKAWWFDKWIRNIEKGNSKLDMVFVNDQMLNIYTDKMLNLGGTFIITNEHDVNWVSQLYCVLDKIQQYSDDHPLRNVQPEPLNMHVIGFKNWADTIKQLNEV